MSENGCYLVFFETWNAHVEKYMRTGSVYVMESEFTHKAESVAQIAQWLLESYVNDEHLRPDGSPLSYPPFEGQYLVRVWGVDTPDGWKEGDEVPPAPEIEPDRPADAIAVSKRG